MKVIYTRTKLRVPVPAQTIVRNPRFFTGPEKGAEAVYIDGEWPDVRAAYASASVPVHDIAELPVDTSDPVPLLRPEDQKPRRKR